MGLAEHTISPEVAVNELLMLVRDQQLYIKQLADKVNALNNTVTEQKLDQFLAVKETAKFLGVSEQHVRDLCHTRLIAHTLVSGVIRIRVRDLNSYIETYTVKAEHNSHYHTRPTATKRGLKKKAQQNRSAL